MAGRVSTKTAHFLSETPDSDLLSDVLKAVRMRARLFKRGRYCGNWALQPAGPSGVVFHLIGRGQAWVHRDGVREPVELRGGDLVMFPHGDVHQISGTPKRHAGSRAGAASGGPFTTVLCARVDFEPGSMNALLHALPRMIVVPSEDEGSSAALHALARLMLAEHEAAAGGGVTVLDRLAEAMFILALRHHMAHARELKGFLGALKDERVARALGAFHREPAAAWRVDTLAREAGMSRTVFAERFAALLGRTPMQYLLAWRMHLANDMLAAGKLSVAQVSERLGYQTETAFRRAFKRVRGVGPGAVRRRARVAG